MTLLVLPPEGEIDFDKELAKLAKTIVQKATLDATPFDESVDAFKALTTYYALRLKHKTGEEDADESAFSFGNTGFAGAEQPNGGQTVRSRSRRPAS